MGMWINIARIGYKWYRDNYICPLVSGGTEVCNRIFDGSGDAMSSTAPGFFSYNLGRAARGHSDDVVNHCWNNNPAHNDCNGTDANGRISKFSTWSGEIYINNAPGGGLYRGYTSVAAWVCDGYHYAGSSSSTLTTLSSCVNDAGVHPDGSQGTAGHRTNIMLRSDQWGCGVYAGSSGGYSTTCDSCNWCSREKYAGLYIAAASHTGDPSDTSKFLYMATVLKEGITVSSMKVIEESAGSKQTITMDKLYDGTSGIIYGTPSYSKPDQCRTYYFELTYGGKTERYPQSGYLYTYGMSCNENWKLSKLTPDCESGECCDTKLKLFRPRTYMCREAKGDCDEAEYCTGGSATCPDDVMKPEGTVCNKSLGVCEENAVCSGTSKTCPKKVVKKDVICRNGTGPCDPPEVCDGENATCPAKAYYPSGYVCNVSSGPCETNGTCNGYSAKCRAKSVMPRGTVCRQVRGLCDVLETCDGTSIECPAEVYKPEGTQCVIRYNCTNKTTHEQYTCMDIQNCTGKSPYCPGEHSVASVSAISVFAVLIAVAMMMLM